MNSNPYPSLNRDVENQVDSGSNPGVNLLLGLLPLSCTIVQIPLANILAPLIAWLCVRKNNPASKPAFQGVMNMQISWTIYGLIIGISCFISFAYAFTHPTDGTVFYGTLIAFITYVIVWLAMTILFAVKVKRNANTNTKPPLSFRFLK